MWFKSPVQVIPFKEFMATNTVGSSYYSSSYLLSADVVNYVDYGLVFFIGLAVVLLGITVLEKYDIKINKDLLRIVVLIIAGSSILYSILNSHLFIGLFR